MACKMVAYYRVSTDQQGRSGLGLEAQKAAVAHHVAQDGCELIGAYTEVETGKRHTLDNRPALKRAIAHARRSKAILVVAKLDRLSRSVAVISMLQQAGVEFVCCDNPKVNRMTVQILAVVAENETRAISDRTKAALAAYKARGGRLGAQLEQCRNLTPAARQKGVEAAAEANALKANEAYLDLGPFVAELREKGLSLQSIANQLNDDGHSTRRGKPWNAMQVSRVLQRAA